MSHRDHIQANISKLVDPTKLNERLLDACVENKIIKRDDRDYILGLGNFFSYDTKSKFYKIFLTVGAKEYEKFVKLIEEPGENKQGDEVIEILKGGIQGNSTSAGVEIPSNQYLRPYKTHTDGPEIKLAESIPKIQSDSIIQQYVVGLRRYALVVNVTLFENQDARHGAEYDSDAVYTVLKNFGFQVHDVNSKITAEDLKNAIEEFKQTCVKGDACVVFLMSHGKRDIIVTSDHQTLSISTDILEQFNNINFQEFIGKPKIFFFQSCRGREADQGVATTMEDGNTITRRWHDSLSALKVPICTDMLVCYSTLEDHFAYREENGSWFIQLLCEKLSAYGNNLDICKILLLVAEQLKMVEGSKGQKQMCPWTNIGFTKEFYFRKT